MKKRVGILVTLGLITVMSMSLLSGCAGKSASTSSVANTKEVTKPEKISYYCSVGTKKEDGSDQFNEEYKKKTGIELEYTPINNNDYIQTLELAFASKQNPDAFNLAGEDQLPLYAAQGALADLTDFVKAAGLITDENKSSWDSVTINGKIYGVPWELDTGTVTYLRKDWLDKLGLKIPTNYEEYINVLRVFKTLPECKNPATGAKLFENGAVSYLKEFYQDSTPEIAKINGKWVDGLQQDNIKPALQRLKDAYKEGLIDPEIITNTTSSARDKWYAGSVGAFNYWSGSWNTSLEDRLKAKVPSAQVVAIPAIENVKYNKRVPAVTCIASNCKNIPGVFKYLLEYMHDGGEGQVLFQYGVEGLHWKQDGDHVTMLPSLSNPKELTTKTFITPYYSLMPLKDSNKKVIIDERINFSDSILKKYGEQQVARPVSKKLGKINSDLIKLKSKIISSIVMGNVGIDEGLANYKKEVKNLGIDEVLNEMNSSK